MTTPAPHPGPAAEPVGTPLRCGCGCGFRIVPGMHVRLIAGVAYALGCVSDPVLVGEHGPDQRDPLDFSAHT